MVRQCVVAKCPISERKNPDKVPFHEFPSDLRRRKQWLAAITSKTEIRGNQERICICGNHFSTDSYRLDTKNRMLLNTAVPSVFHNEFDQPPENKRPRTCEPSNDTGDDVIGPIQGIDRFQFHLLRKCN